MIRAVLTIMVVSLSVSDVAHAQDGLFGSPGRFSEPDGDSLWRGVCAGCHMADGQGARGAGAYPSLAGDERLAQAAYPIAVILRGQRAMPAFGRSLTDAQVAAVVAYIRGHFGNDYGNPPSDADVRALR